MDAKVEIIFDNGDCVTVHPAVLALASPVFSSMLTQDMAEKRTGQIHLKDKKKEEFETVLDFLMPGKRERVTEENVGFVMAWADEYCMEALKKECTVLIESLPPTADNLQLAWKWNLRATVDKMLAHLKLPENSGANGLADAVNCPELLRVVLRSVQEECKRRLPEKHLHPDGKMARDHQLQCGKCRKPPPKTVRHDGPYIRLPVVYEPHEWQCRKCAYK
eukprot:TRINITY_DN84723_c0_g1_i1.p1 TRINITY_DN84723_c0_g1~~TRINITY_DN84723_c0_g1_i1.p1  ORF type:complete len:220 (-),score=52.16 TRINITY_DN84723_c0_g1_i1:83-742(-)